MLTVSEWVSDNITSRASGGAKNEKAIITMKSVFLWFRTIYLPTTVALSQLLHQFFNIGIGDDAAERDSSGQLEEGLKSFNNKRLPMKDEKSTRWWWPRWSEPELRQLGGYTGSLIISIGHIRSLARVCTTTLKDQTRARCLWPRWSVASNVMQRSSV